MIENISNFIPKDTITVENGKEAINLQLQSMIEAFSQGESVNNLVIERTKFIDSLLKKLWYQFEFDKFENFTLVAVGGYGRKDLQPHSDIDILFLSSDSINNDQASKIADFNALLWDLKLDIGQSVRTIDECISEGKKDVTIATNLLESRIIIGNVHNFEKLLNKINSDDFWTSSAFYKAKYQEQKDRHSSYKDTGYRLEPDIKNNPGGLRDIQTILWIAQKKLGIKTLKDMQTHNILTKLEFSELKQCQDFLWRVRFALHISINKPDNRLTFDRQLKVANLLGYDGEGNTPVETLMRRFFNTMHRVREINEIVMQLMEKIIFPENIPEGKIYNKHFIIRGHLIDVIDPEIFIKKPQTILELFLILTNETSLTGIYVECIRLLRKARRSINFYLEEIPECREIFKQIIKKTRALTVAFPLMHKHYIFALYMPHWSEILGLMQFDMFHTYTVDEHTMRVLKNIYHFTHDKDKNISLFKQVYSQIDKPELLFIAAIFHDIAKSRKGHHAELGAPDALYFCQLHGYNRFESRLVAWVVRNHLFMSTVAQRRDISDPEVVNDFAKKVGDETYLNYLFCLTVADICATNDTEWNTYKDSLFTNLYLSTRDALRRGLENPPDLKLHVRENQQRALDILTERGISPILIFKIWGTFKLEYFIRYTADQIAWHTQNIICHQNLDTPLILFTQSKDSLGSDLFIYTKDIEGLFAKVTAVLGDKNFNVLASLISNTNQNYALDTFTFLDKNGAEITFDRLSNLKKAITKALMTDFYIPPKNRTLPIKLKQFKHPTNVTYLEDKDHKGTYIEISSLDVPGLLAMIGNIFQTHNLIIHAAKITTTGERADDFFLLTDKFGNPLTEEIKIKLKDHLIEVLDFSPNKE